MTFTEAAEAVLRKIGKPLHYKKITQFAIEQNLLSHVGKTPEVTMSTRLATLTKKDRGEAAIVRVKPGVFGLRDWGATASDVAEEEAAEETEEAAEETPEVEAAAGKTVVAAVAEAHSPEEQERAQRLAEAAKLFPEEEDDNEPVLGEKPAPAAAAAAAGEAGEGGRRRRRRRRGRGRSERGEAGAVPPSDASSAEGAELEGDEGEEFAEGGAPEGGELAPMEGEGLVAAGELAPVEGEGLVVAGEAAIAAVPPGEGGAPESAPRSEWRREGRREERRDDRREERRDDRREFDRGERRDDRREERRELDRGGEPASEAGRDAADLLVSLLARREDRQPVALRALADDAARAGKLVGEPHVLVPTLAAAARADGARREARGERPRLRVSNGRVGLVDWSLGPDLVRAEADVLIALERLRDVARRQVIRRLNELPQPSFIELIVLLLERLGISSLKPARRPGLPQGEVHLSGVARRANEEIRTAVLLKRGGEVGRERVIELRGSLHHYGPATTAWVLTTGNVLSGAREEATQVGTSAVTLIDGAALGRLFDENSVATRHASVSVPYPDLDLFEALRGV